MNIVKGHSSQFILGSFKKFKVAVRWHRYIAKKKFSSQKIDFLEEFVIAFNMLYLHTTQRYFGRNNDNSGLFPC